MLIPLLAAALMAQGGAMAQEGLYKNPVDGKSYYATWQQYSPQGGEDDMIGTVALRGTRILGGKGIFEKNIAGDDLEQLVRSTYSNIAFVAGGAGRDFAVLVETKLSAGAKPSSQVATRGKVPSDLVRKISESLKVLPDIRTNGDEIKYQLEFDIKGGGSGAHPKPEAGSAKQEPKTKNGSGQPGPKTEAGDDKQNGAAK